MSKLVTNVQNILEHVQILDVGLSNLSREANEKFPQIAALGKSMASAQRVDRIASGLQELRSAVDDFKSFDLQIQELQYTVDILRHAGGHPMIPPLQYHPLGE